MAFRTIPSLIAVAALCVGAVAQQQLAPPNRAEIVAPAQPPSKKHVPPPVKTPRTGKVSARKQVAQPMPPQPPPAPATLENQPPVAPQVTYAGGQLTINAPNSRLSDVISAVKRATGVAFDGATSDERVAVRLGPGSPHDVINALLHGSHFDYVIVGADNDPAGVQRVLLTAPSSAPPTQPGTVVTQNARGNMARPLPPNPNNVDPDMNNTDEVPDETVTEQPPENANVEGNPNNQDQENNQNNGEVQNNNEENQQQQPKTPQQLLQELQQLQQQQQQNIQNQQNQNQNQPVPPGQPMPNQPNPNQNEQNQQPPL